MTYLFAEHDFVPHGHKAVFHSCAFILSGIEILILSSWINGRVSDDKFSSILGSLDKHLCLCYFIMKRILSSMQKAYLLSNSFCLFLHFAPHVTMSFQNSAFCYISIDLNQ